MPKKYCGGSGLALQTPIPLHPTGQKTYFWIPRTGVFEMHHAKKSGLWVLGWRSKHPHLCTPPGRKPVFGYLRWVRLKRTMPKNIAWVLGWRSRHPYLCTPRARKAGFWIPRMGVFETHHAKKYCVGSGLALQTPMPLHTTGQTTCFGYLESVCLKCTMPKKTLCGF